MKRWAALTVLVYLLAQLLLAVPVIVIAFSTGKHVFSVKEAESVYRESVYWAWLAILIGGQALLLLLPINIAEKRLRARRQLAVPMAVTGFLLGGLMMTGLFSFLAAIYGDRVPSYYNLGYDFHGQDTAIGGFMTGVVTLLTFWLIWMIVFRRFAERDDPHTLVKRSIRWLLRGSILELLVAVPSHVIVRRRGDCCAPFTTFWGIATGISVMLLCFGPGVFFLFVERFQRLKPKEIAAE